VHTRRSPSRESGGTEIHLAGERLVLLPERAAFRPAMETLLVADPHFGKGAAFRAFGVPVPGGTTAATLERLARAVEHTGARRIVFLGDFFHARAGRAAGTLDALARWRDAHAALKLMLVRGNHDLHAGDPPPELGIEACNGPCPAPPFAYAHHPVDSPAGYVLAGHLHPSVTLRGAGRQRQRLPCFHFGARCGVLPAFGEFTGTAEVRAREGDRLFVVAEGEVIAVAGEGA
jgi:DNA ligase-associated metallophosphoesterase